MADVKENEEEKKKKNKKKKQDEKEVNKESDQEEYEEEKTGSKVFLVFIALFIIVIWLAIIALMIKMDVGGFGSSVLYPVLKDVPYINRILPETENGDSDANLVYQYATIDDAVERIKELELELAEATASDDADAQTIAHPQAQVAELSVYKEEQASFELEKEKFYEEVVFSDEAPDIEEYKAYYESIDPENAEVLYKQVVEQLAYSQEIEDYVKTYSSMKPKEAAAIFNTMTDDLGLVAEILSAMDTQSRADIL